VKAITMRPWLSRSLFVVSAVAVGIAAAWGWVGKGGDASTVQAGPWRASTLTGSADSGALLRAQVAVAGLLALNRQETMYYVAREDSAGQRLRANCKYTIQGPTPAARWWSITAYADDYFLFTVPSGRYSFNSEQHRQIMRDQPEKQLTFSMQTSPEPSGPAWHLPTPTSGKSSGLVLTLRLYNPAPQLAQAPETLKAPSIERIGECA
jgi:hypothetical protein